ncbi:MAG: hypothetical protein PHU64_05285 [Candidatus Omnitrophica bacterium]|jgi:hypothetical protein|nr:hypothetical protein [Candidatus Omnitrophota bacterium]MDD5430151.1 hypothetical protein [Candidatus Omnitrophota bacterium]
MKAFFIGLLFVIMVAIFAGLGFMLYPFIIVLALFSRVIISLLLVAFTIWLLGKFIILVWEKLRK